MLRKHIKKLLIFLFSEIVAIIVYLISIWLYCEISNYPIIFFTSVIFALVIAFLISIIVKKIFDKDNLLDSAYLVMMYISISATIVLFAILGPTFIDRSISYHIAFYAEENGEIDYKDLEEAWSNDIFEKRFNDAVESGLLIQKDANTYVPSKKTNIIAKILKILGKITNSLSTYDDMKVKMEEKVNEQKNSY